MGSTASSPSSLYIGLMSGTSLDGVDGVLVDFRDRPRVLAHASCPLPGPLRDEFLALNTPGENELARAALAAQALVQLYAQVAQALIAQAPGPVRAIGAHGQTVRHQPQVGGGVGYTLQLNQPALLAELTGIDVVADFRNADLAAGGQGAPLVPAFHAALWAQAGEARAVLNIGGISNLTLLGADGSVLGFDCGPGNALLDHWCQSHTGRSYDESGAWAATGQVLPRLLEALLAEPFLSLPPPKSTGRDLFNPAWLEAKLQQWTGNQTRPQDVQATLTAFTAHACAQDLRRHAAGCTQLWVCGGGALNRQLMQHLSAQLPGVAVQPTDALGLPVMQVEAAAFAWLARAWFAREPASLPAVTGARAARVLGALYPARTPA